jgi:spore coat protein A
VKAILNLDTQPKFVNHLPTPPLLDTEAGGSYRIDIRQDRQWLGLVDANGNRLYTTIWGYALPGMQPTVPGPTILASSNIPADISWKNLLPKDSELLPVDLSITDPDVAKAITGGYSPTVTHLHGGHTAQPVTAIPTLGSQIAMHKPALSLLATIPGSGGQMVVDKLGPDFQGTVG